MKNSTTPLQPVYHLIKEELLHKKFKSYDITLAQNEFLNKDDYIGFYQSEPEPINFLSVE